MIVKYNGEYYQCTQATGSSDSQIDVNFNEDLAVVFFGGFIISFVLFLACFLISND